MLKVHNKLISVPIKTILQQLRKETGNRYFKDINTHGNQLMVTCPFHADGNENHPSCGVVEDSDKFKSGTFHCFTCGQSGTLHDLIAFCFNENIMFAEDWLEERFGDTFVVVQELLPEIDLNKKSINYLDESVLDEYKYFHPYQFQRGLTEDVIKKFSIGSTADGKYITFPCWDEHNHLIGIYKRSTTNKEFIIPKQITKCVYLLNFCLQENKTTVYVCEGQLDALKLWAWGYPAIALFGTGSKQQYDILKKSGIRNYILCFDGDEAGHKGEKRFIHNMPDNIFISSKILPDGKDVNDLTKEEFDELGIR